MKTKNFLRCIAAVAVLFTACSKDETPQDEASQNSSSQRMVNIAAININGSKSQVMSVALESMERKALSIDCYVATSTSFDAKNKTFGYQGCDSIYRIVDVEAGVEVKQIPLPAYLNLVVIDTTRNVLIGHYYVNDEKESEGAGHVLMVNLNDGRIMSDKQFYVGETWQSSTCFFREAEGEYVLLNADNVLVFTNPHTGEITKKLNIEVAINNGIYDAKNNRLIGVTALDEEANYIVTADLSSGKTLSKAETQDLGAHLAFESAYDAETNSCVLVGADNEVLFFDVATGKVSNRYQLDFKLTSLKLWRSNR